jgi:uncharacterized protein YndB with AHSA1/START domain
MKAIEKDSVKIEKVINASVENIWRAWTDPQLIIQWFGSDPQGKGLKAKLDVRPGGSFEVLFKDADGTEHCCYGIYKEVEAFSYLKFSWEWRSEPGVETLVTVSLKPQGNFTQMIFEHSHLGNASKHNYLNGWNTTFLKLEKLMVTSNK